jgi:hypothetical protein
VQGSGLSRDETLANLIVIAVADIATGIAEGILTGYIVSFIGRIRPDLLRDTERGAGGTASGAEGAIASV